MSCYESMKACVGVCNESTNLSAWAGSVASTCTCTHACAHVLSMCVQMWKGYAVQECEYMRACLTREGRISDLTSLPLSWKGW